MKQRKGFFFKKNVGLGNQLVVLYHIYNTCPDVEDLYFPHMDQCRTYLNCDKFRTAEYFNSNSDKFRAIGWDDAKDSGNLLRFHELNLNREHQSHMDSMVEKLGGGDLVAIHMRHGDYDHWNDGKFYFSTQRYLDEAMAAADRWGISNPSIIVFSNERKDGVKFSWDITGGTPVYDLFLMSYCNYFIRTYSTFSGIASRISQNRGIFKGEFIVSD